MNLKQKSGFTLLEIIIVIIIVGVLASLALPRLFATVEYSRSTEALETIGAVKRSVERCSIATVGNTFVGCGIGSIDFNPAGAANAHFTYATSNLAATTYTITATRNTVDGGVSTDTIVLAFAAGAFTRTGTTAFAGIK